MAHTMPSHAPELVESLQRRWERAGVTHSRKPHRLIQDSWVRSAHLGLNADQATLGMPDTSAAQLRRLLDKQRELMAHACPVMHRLSRQIRAQDCVLMLAEPGGVVLCSLGSDLISEHAASVALKAGANWHERWRGTNAIGTAIATGNPVVVEGQEHFMARHAFLSCAAAPIRAPQGHLTAVLDVSARRGHLSSAALSLLWQAARQIEHLLFLSTFSSEIIVRLHPRREVIGTVNEGLLALNEAGQLVAADGVARALLRLSEVDMRGLAVESMLGVTLATLTGSAGGLIVPLHVMQPGGNTAVFGQIQVNGTPLEWPPRAAA